MRIIVSDSSCLIDLRKVGLVEAFLKLPYEFLIPNTLFEDELLKFTAAQKRALVKGGLTVTDLPGERVLRAQGVDSRTTSPHPSRWLCLRSREGYPGCILLTGDGGLRAFAVAQEVEVRGVLWLIDELHRHGVDTAANLLVVLEQLAVDPTVRLPRRELAAFIKRYRALC